MAELFLLCAAIVPAFVFSSVAHSQNLALYHVAWYQDSGLVNRVTFFHW